MAVGHKQVEKTQVSYKACKKIIILMKSQASFAEQVFPPDVDDHRYPEDDDDDNGDCDFDADDDDDAGSVAYDAIMMLMKLMMMRIILMTTI